MLIGLQAAQGPPASDLLDLGWFLLVSGAAALLAGSGARLCAQRGLIRSVRTQIVVIPVLVVSLAAANVWFTSHLMFVSAHDFTLLTLVLLFALALALVLSVVLSESLGNGIRDLGNAVRAVASGDLRARAVVHSSDELGGLAQAFNRMAEQLEASFARQQDLERARREMVVAVSHDLRTPLSSIRAMTESINDGVVDDPETVRRYLRTMEAEVARLSTLIDDLFELSQIDAGALELHLEPASLPDLISDTLEAMRAQARQRGLALEGEVADGLPDVLVDSRRIQRVLFNLVQNAIRHTAAGSVFIHARAAGAEVAVEVSDTGEGIAREDLPRVFEPFYQGDKARSRKDGGSGLGLSIVKALVEAHGGRVWAASEPGKGSTFGFTLRTR